MKLLQTFIYNCSYFVLVRRSLSHKTTVSSRISATWQSNVRLPCLSDSLRRSETSSTVHRLPLTKTELSLTFFEECLRVGNFLMQMTISTVKAKVSTCSLSWKKESPSVYAVIYGTMKILNP